MLLYGFLRTVEALAVAALLVVLIAAINRG